MLWNPLGTRWGRLVAFFLLYVTEGIPLGFTATAVVAQMRRGGVSPKEIGLFVTALYLPWSWKWVVGPIVDCVYSVRLGRRRAWIVAAQSMMCLPLLLGIGVDLSSEVKLFTVLVVVVNIFGAVQDVAIDALAVSVLAEDERGFANGLMFGGAYAGQAVGGSVVLLLANYMDFRWTFLFVCACILSVTVFVSLQLKERGLPARDDEDPGHRGVLAAITTYPIIALKAFFGTKQARAALVFAALPCGAYALSLALQTNLSVELGLSNTRIALLSFISTIVSGVFCVIGGLLSDRLGRRRMLAVYIVLMSVPTIVLAIAMRKAGWILPIDPTDPDRPIPPYWLLVVFWSVTIGYAVFNGLMYGTRTALFMDVCSPAVAATQFTAYMAILNLAIAYTSAWQGYAIEAWGYPVTLIVDGTAGLLCLGLLPMISKLKVSAPRTP